MVTYRQITTRDHEYVLEKELRNRLLRRPLGLELSEADLRGEEEQAHIVAVDDGERVIGCVLVSFTGEPAKVRQLAADEAYQGRGIGAALMMRAEDAIRARCIRSAELHARVTARGFFERLGYTATSDVFTEVTIPHVRMEKALVIASSWLSAWMTTNGIELWGVADLGDIAAPVDPSGTAFPRAIAYAVAMAPAIMAGTRNGPNQAYADEYARVNELIDGLGKALEEELGNRGCRALRIASSVRTDAVRLAGVFPHKTAATRAGLGWIGKNCQLVTRSHGPWVRLGTVLTDLDIPCGAPMERGSCGACVQCVDACPAKALKGALWHPGTPREALLDAPACDRWKKENYFRYHQGRNCGICSAVCPFGSRTLMAKTGQAKDRSRGRSPA